MKLTKLLAATVLATASASVLATPAVTFRVDGNTFGSPAFSVVNQSDDMERITRIVFDMTGFGYVFDTAQGGAPGNNSDWQQFDPVASQALDVGLVGPVMIADGSALIDISFTSFLADDDGVPDTKPGIFSWGIDIDSSDGRVVTVTGNLLAGISATIYFSDNSSLTGRLALDTADAQGDASFFTVVGGPPQPTPMPEPGSLALAGMALLALGAARSRRR